MPLAGPLTSARMNAARAIAHTCRPETSSSAWNVVCLSHLLERCHCDRPDPRRSFDWRGLSAGAATQACGMYRVGESWIPVIAESTLGIISSESRFGHGRRYRCKRMLQFVASSCTLFSRLVPDAQGVAQVKQERLDYLSRDLNLCRKIDLWSSEGAIETTALGLAKAVSLLFPNQQHRPSKSETAIVVVTHNAGWMTPRVARLQDVLAKLKLLEPRTRRSGFVGPLTLAALNCAASRFGCDGLAELLLAVGVSKPPAFCLTHPDLYPLFRRSDLFRLLYESARAIGEDLDAPLFPDYRFRRWHTGWISSVGYADSVLSHPSADDRGR